MKHLVVYANFLDGKHDWRHFPIRKEDQPVRMFKKLLIKRRDDGLIEPGTATAGMAAVSKFYRHAQSKRLIKPDRPMWVDRTVTILTPDTRGFMRAISRVSSDLSIKNVAREGVSLEDGLLPLKKEDMQDLVKFVSKDGNVALHCMLNTGFFSGARVETVSTITTSALKTLRKHPLIDGVSLMKVGPGTNIQTKGDVKGDIWIPDVLRNDLQMYARSDERLQREAKAKPEHRGLLFLNKNGAPYDTNSIGGLVRKMRVRAYRAGLAFAADFKFHQSRATFGTWLMQLLLDAGPASEAIGVVRDALLHKFERTTWKYIRFLEVSKQMSVAAAEFDEAFFGLRGKQKAADK
jgi:integrase